MGKNKISIIIAKEYLTRVKKKSFILLTILTPLFFGAVLVVPSLVMMYSDEDKTTIKISDNTGVIMPYFKNTENITFEDAGTVTFDKAKAKYDENGEIPLVYISPMDSSKNVSVTIYAPKQVNFDVQSKISSVIKKAIEDNKLSAYNIPNLDAIMKDIKTDVSLRTFEVSDSGEVKESKVEISMAIGYVASFLIYLFVFMFGGMVMRSVVEEKSSRVVEVIVSSAKPMQLMMGKIIGVALVALTQFTIWIVLTIAIVVGVSSTIGMKAQENLAIPNAQMAGMENVSDANIPLDAVSAVANNVQDAENEVLDSYLNAIKQVDYVQIIIVFILYFVLGYLLYASMFAAVGAACDNETDTQQLILPISMPLIIGMFIMLHAFRFPDSSLSFWGSMIPFTSPMVMMARISYGVPLWELALSIGIMILTFIFIAYLSAKIYRTGILMYGKKNGWKEIFKWLKN